MPEYAAIPYRRLIEPVSLAIAWHQTGMVYQRMQRFDAAEAAHRQSLRIRAQQGDRAGEAASLGQLSNLYGAMERREEAVTLSRQAAEIYLGQQDLANEGRARGNAADDLIKLNRHDEARTELLRAIECNAPYGHAAEPWKTFDLLTRLEQATGNPEAAAPARQRAIAAFLDYRRDGGENLTGCPTSQLAAGIARAIQENETEAAARQLAERQQDPDLPGYLEPLIPALKRILAGSRDPALADDPKLDYDDAAELKLLLKQIRRLG